jgi:hypothetical protein
MDSARGSGLFLSMRPTASMTTKKDRDRGRGQELANTASYAARGDVAATPFWWLTKVGATISALI